MSPLLTPLFLWTLLYSSSILNMYSFCYFSTLDISILIDYPRFLIYLKSLASLLLSVIIYMLSPSELILVLCMSALFPRTVSTFSIESYRSFKSFYDCDYQSLSSRTSLFIRSYVGEANYEELIDFLSLFSLL